MGSARQHMGSAFAILPLQKVPIGGWQDYKPRPSPNGPARAVNTNEAEKQASFEISDFLPPIWHGGCSYTPSTQPNTARSAWKYRRQSPTPPAFTPRRCFQVDLAQVTILPNPIPQTFPKPPAPPAGGSLLFTPQCRFVSSRRGAFDAERGNHHGALLRATFPTKSKISSGRP